MNKIFYSYTSQTVFAGITGFVRLPVIEAGRKMNIVSLYWDVQLIRRINGVVDSILPLEQNDVFVMELNITSYAPNTINFSRFAAPITVPAATVINFPTFSKPGYIPCDGYTFFNAMFFEVNFSNLDLVYTYDFKNSLRAEIQYIK